MRLRATVKITNDIVKRRRESLGMSQKEYGLIFGVSPVKISEIECLRIRTKGQKMISLAESIADDCGVSVNDILPDEIVGLKLPNMVSVAEVDNAVIESSALRNKMISMDVDKIDEDAIKEAKSAAISSAMNCLSERERACVNGHIDGITLDDVARTLNPQVSRERARQITIKAFKKLRRHPKIDVLSESYGAIPKRCDLVNRTMTDEQYERELDYASR